MRRLILPVLLVALVAPTGGGAERLQFGRPLRGNIVRHYEPPAHAYAAGHRGIDLAASYGSPVSASEAGTVSFAGQVGGRLYVSVDHPEGLRSTYSYLSELAVQRGQLVEKGQLVGRSGWGHEEGGERPHLHFGLRRDGEYLDPEAYLLSAIKADLSQVIRLVA